MGANDVFGYKLDQIEKKIVGAAVTLLSLSAFFIVDDRLLFKLASSDSENQKKVAMVSYSANDVRRRTETDLTWFPISGRDDVYQGDSVFTGNESKAELSIQGGSKVALDPDSLVVIRVTANNARLDVRKGSVSGKISGNQKIFLGSGSQTTELSGTNAVVKVKVDDTGKTQLKVLEGSAVVKDGGKPRTLSKNESQVLALVQVINPAEISMPPPLLVPPPPAVDVRVAEAEKPAPKAPQKPVTKAPPAQATPTPKLTPVLKSPQVAQHLAPEPKVAPVPKAEVARAAPAPKPSPFANALPRREVASTTKPTSAPKPSVKPSPAPSPSPSLAPEVVEEDHGPKPEGIAPRAGKVVRVYDKDAAQSDFSWTKIDTAKLYRFELSKNLDFSKVERSEVTVTEGISLNDLPDGKLYWRVRAENERSTSDWSRIYTFTIQRDALTRDLASTPGLKPQTLSTAQIEELQEYKLYDPKFQFEIGWGYAASNMLGSNLPSGLQSSGFGMAPTTGFLNVDWFPGGNEGRWGLGAEFGYTYSTIAFTGVSGVVNEPRASLQLKRRLGSPSKFGVTVGFGAQLLPRYFVDTSVATPITQSFYDPYVIGSAFASYIPGGGAFEFKFGATLGKTVLDLSSADLIPEAGVSYRFKNRFTAGIKYRGTFQRWPSTFTNKTTGAKTTGIIYDMENTGYVTFGVGF